MLMPPAKVEVPVALTSSAPESVPPSVERYGNAGISEGVRPLTPFTDTFVSTRLLSLSILITGAYASIGALEPEYISAIWPRINLSCAYTSSFWDVLFPAVLT
jgi:hypothetical protein